MCEYGIAWVGKCKLDGEPFCTKHAPEKCSSCGEQATHECDETGQFVCGSPLCAKCEHTLHEDGTNGGIGFYQTAPLPPGMKQHCRKGEQKATPWWEREKEAAHDPDGHVPVEQ